MRWLWRRGWLIWIMVFRRTASCVVSSFRAIARQWRVLHAHRLFFTPWQARAVHRDGLRYLFASKRLFWESRSRGSKRWALLPKHHQLLHLLQRVKQTRRNPGSHWCFADERYVGTIKRVIPHMRPGRRGGSRRVLQRHYIRLRLRFADRLDRAAAARG